MQSIATVDLTIKGTELNCVLVFRVGERPRVFLKKSNQLKNNNQFVRGGSPRLRGNIGYCHLVVEQVGGSHHRSPESPCGTLRMLHAVMQATPAAVASKELICLTRRC